MKILGKLFSNINNINKNIFFETLLLIGALCLLIIAYVIVFAFFPIVKANQEKNISLYSNAVNSVQSMVDYSLLNMHDILTKTSQERCIINAIVSPESNSSDMEVLFSISSLSGENELIDKVFLYIPKNDKVFISKYVLTNLDQFSNKDIIDNYYGNSNNGNCIERNGRITRIIQYGADLYLVRDFPLDGAKRLGTFFIKLNKNKLLRNASITKAVSPNELFIYDSKGLPLFNEPASNQYRGVLSSIKAGATNIVGKVNRRLFLYSKSGITQLQYFFTIDEAKILNIRQIVFLPVPILILCLLMALFVTKKILLPIKNILYIANNTKIDNWNHRIATNSANGLETDRSSNSINDLKITFANVLNSISHLTNTLKVLQPDILDIIFQDLLSGKPMQIPDIANVLNSVNSPITVDGIYNILVLDIERTEALPLIDDFWALCKNVLDEKNGGNFEAYYLHTITAYSYVIIFQFDKVAPIGNIKLFVSELRENFLRKAGNLNMDIAIRSGNTCNSILDLHFSFNKACQQNASDPSVNASNVLPDSDTYYNQDYFAEHSQQFFELLRTNNETGALLSVQQVLNDIHGKNDLEYARLHYNLYVESIFDILLKFKNINFNKSDLFQIETIINTTNNPEDMKSAINVFHQQVIALALIHYKKLNNPYIIKAENYIMKCYDDPSLSLSTVAEFLNTNATYLSKLFKERVGTNFNDYLNSYRIEKAKALLCNSDIKIESVAIATGFNSQQNFIRVFKKSEGITPGQYRYRNQDAV